MTFVSTKEFDTMLVKAHLLGGCSTRYDSTLKAYVLITPEGEFASKVVIKPSREE